MPTLVAMLQGRFRPFRLIREGAGDGAFWLGRGLELVADWVFLVALIGATWMLTRDVPAVALVVLARLLPRPLILLAGGAFARRMGGNALVLLDVGRAVVAGAVALTVLGGSSGVLALGVSAAIYGVFTALAAEGRVRLLGALAPPTRLGETAALDGLVARLAYFGGPLVATALIGLGDLRVALLASAVASVGAAVLVAMRGGDVARSRAEQVPVTSVALREVIGHPRLLLVAVAGLVSGATATGLMIALLPLISSPADLGSPAVLGLLLGAVGLGTVLG
ncbi:MAG: hypothetical protein H0V04_00440, partial [Chloroflexi bacterium]|nr:hypothetical protein [Chloroflexota bacterium]